MAGRIIDNFYKCSFLQSAGSGSLLRCGATNAGEFGLETLLFPGPDCEDADYAVSAKPSMSIA